MSEPGTCRIAFWHRPFLNAGTPRRRGGRGAAVERGARPRGARDHRPRPQHAALQAHRGDGAADLRSGRPRALLRATRTTRGSSGTRTTSSARCASTCAAASPASASSNEDGKTLHRGRVRCQPLRAERSAYWITGSSLPPKPGAAAIAGICTTGSSRGVAATMPRARCISDCAAGASGSSATSGTPSSACTRSSSWSGILPSSGRPDLVREQLAAALAEDRVALCRRES